MLLRGATLASFDPPHVEVADLRIEGDRITTRGLSLAPQSGEDVADLTGALVIPGLVNAHTHLYRTLARGMPWPQDARRTLLQILERVWWRLDLALDEEAVTLSALAGGTEAALSGTTLLIDHHSSPSWIRGSLGAVKRGLEQVGLRSVLCYEVTDRNGTEARHFGIEENIEFQKGEQTPLTRGMVGAHASFTLASETMEGLLWAVQQTGSSLHVHVAEDSFDADDCHRRYSLPLTERFFRHGLIASRTIFAHCVHLTAGQIEEVHRHGGWVAHNPRSNMNHGVGHAPTAAMRRAALGTDGLDEDVFAEAQAAYLKMRDAGRGDASQAVLEMVAGGHRLAAVLFGLPFGKLDAGGPADLVVLDYAPVTPLRSDTLAAHLVNGIGRAHVKDVYVAGRPVVRDRKVVSLDAAAVRGRAVGVAERLWARMRIDAGAR
jgi:putative selenium metabolism protein SsnA